MSSRSFLYGLGSGLLAAAALVWAMPGQPHAALSQEELAAIAQQKKLVLVPQAEYDQLKQADKGTAAPPVKAPASPAQPQSQAPKQPAAGDPSAVNQPTNPGQAAAPAGKTPATPVSDGAGNAATAPGIQQPPAAKEPVANEPATPAEIVTVRIPGATNATAAGKLMVEAGLIQSADQLVNALRAAGKLDRIRASTYQIPKGTSIDDIVKRITTPPKK